MTTFADLIASTRRHLMAGQPDRLNQLVGPIDTSSTLITLAHTPKGVSENTQLAIGLEEFHVLSVSGNNVTVIRGVNGSTPQAHLQTELVYVNPQFSDFRIADYINQSLNSLTTSSLFQIKSTEFTFTPTRKGYDLPTDGLIDIWEVRYDYPGPQHEWPSIVKPFWYLDQAANTTEFPSGQQIVLLKGGFPGHEVRVSYKARYEQLANLTDDVEAVSGLHFEAHDIPPLWAAVRLLSGRDVKRTFLTRQPEPRRQEEVPPGAATQSIQPLAILLFDRLNEESNRLKRRYPLNT